MEEAPASAESGEPQPGTSKDSEEMEGSPMPAEESEMEGLEGAVGGAVGGSDWCDIAVVTCLLLYSQLTYAFTYQASVWYMFQQASYCGVESIDIS